ncbi:hypothetical protein KJ853_01890 [Patescibacteria group bacterium]|nr:hypothetical protein [Patescibacteria group bacterium]
MKSTNAIFRQSQYWLVFLRDNLTLKRIDLWIDNLIIIVYLFIIGLTIKASCRVNGGWM